MPRDFCLHCGRRPLQSPCPCGVAPERLGALRQREKEHLNAFQLGHPLRLHELERSVVTDRGPVLLRQLLTDLQHAGVLWESGFRATERGVMQLVYRAECGSELLRWDFV